MAQAMPVIMAISTAYSIYSGVEASKAQKDAANEAERIGRENAANIEAETREEARRMADAQSQEGGKARAMAAASGATGETLNTFLSDLDQGHAESLAWLEKSGANRARLAEITGAYTAAGGRAAASSTLAGTASNAASGASQTYQAGVTASWW